MNLVSRAQWKARAPKQRQALAKSEQRGTAVHYSGANADEQADHKNCAGRVRSIQNFHMDGRGWADIAYSYLACKHGFVFEGRGRGVRTAAQGTNSGNDGYHAVCFLGDDSLGRDDVTDEGRLAIKAAVAFCNAWAKVKDVRPHSSFHATGCPGDELRAWIARSLPTRPAAVSEEDSMAALFDDKAEFESAVERAVDHVMSQGLTGDRDGAIRAWAAQLDQVKAAQKETAELVRQVLLRLGGSE